MSFLTTRAVEILLEPFVDFRFVSVADQAHTVALSILPFVLPLIDGPTPLHAIDKPVRGSGGGLLTDVALWPALGGPSQKTTDAGDESEWWRTILAKLLCGSPAIVIDNVLMKLSSAALASALTEAVVEDRVIRSSTVARVSTSRVWVVTGNNLVMSDELLRRSIWIRIDSGCERPEDRQTFRHRHLKRWVSAHRAQLVHAILTVCQA